MYSDLSCATVTILLRFTIYSEETYSTHSNLYLYTITGQDYSQLMVSCSTDGPSSTDNTTPEQRALQTVPANSLPSSNTTTKSLALEQESYQIQGNKTFFVCKYCGKCTLEQFFSKEGCFSNLPQASTDKKILFPYLDMSGLDEDDKIDLEDQLETETREIILQFASFMTDVEESLEHSLVPLDKIKHSILNLQAFTNNLAVKILDEEDKQKIENAKTLSEVFITLVNYISFFNYHIIEYIIKKHGSAKDHERFQEYLESFRNYCQRSIFEVPQHVLSSTSRKTAKVLAFKFTGEENDKVKGIEGVKGRIAKIFQLRSSALQLCSIKKGCVELHFLISAAVADHIFPVSPSQHSALSKIGVIVLSCEGVEQPSVRRLSECYRVGVYCPII